LYLTDFLKCTFLRENVKNRAFGGGIKSTRLAVHHAGIKHGVVLGKSTLYSYRFWSSLGPAPTLEDCWGRHARGIIQAEVMTLHDAKL
jgi:hypothetical protein